MQERITQLRRRHHRRSDPIGLYIGGQVCLPGAVASRVMRHRIEEQAWSLVEVGAVDLEVCVDGLDPLQLANLPSSTYCCVRNSSLSLGEMCGACRGGAVPSDFLQYAD